MKIEELQAVKFTDLDEDEEFWKPLISGKTPKGMADMTGPYYVYTATGHVLNKLFQLKKRLADHELMNVALDAEKNELYLMAPSDVVYIRKNQSL
jgi:hypothetical protein